MKLFILILSVICVAFAHHKGPPSYRRAKRNVAGTLDIVSNNAHPIHAEVKPENIAQDTPKTDKVTPPKDVVYEGKVLRRSWPMTSRLDFVRTVSRIVTLGVLLVSAAVEFYPLIQHFVSMFNNNTTGSFSDY